MLAESIYEMIQLTADETGKIVHSFTVPEERDGVSNYGEYDVFVKPFGEDVLNLVRCLLKYFV